MIFSRNSALVALSISMLLACSSKETKPNGPPSWTQQPTRTIDNGYIIYVGRGESGTTENAEFKASGVALEDLANECSMVPKGTRVEDRFAETTTTGIIAYTKIGVEFQTCDQASKAVDPDLIRKLASEPFTQEVRRYQEFEETGTAPKTTDLAAAEPPEEIQPPPLIASSSVGGSAPNGGGNSSVQFYAVRQYVSYQKQIVILSPSYAYAPGSTRANQFNAVMTPAVNEVQTAQLTNPNLRTNPTPWSAVPNRPVMPRPLALRPVTYRQNPAVRSNSPVAPYATRGAPRPRYQQNSSRRQPPPPKRSGRARRRCDRGRC